MSEPDLDNFPEEVNLSPIRDEDEVFLIRVPKGFDINKLRKVSYLPPGNVQIEAKEGRRGMVSVMELSSHEGQEMNLNLLVKSKDGEIVAGPSITKTLCVSKSVYLNPSVSSKPLRNLGTSSPVAFPTGLKQRFSPFGAGHPVKMKGKKKKKQSKRKRSEDISEDSKLGKRIKLQNSVNITPPFSQTEDFGYNSNSCSQIVSKKHKKKTKRQSRAESPDDSQRGSQIRVNSSYCSDETFSPSRHGRGDSKTDIDTSVFMNSNDNYVQFNSGGNTSEEFMNASSNASHKKKKAKRKLSSGYQSLDISADEPVASQSTSEERKLKKKRKKEKEKY